MTQYLRGLGYVINRKRVQRLMQKLGLAGMTLDPNTSKQHPQHILYPYLLRGVDIIAPNQVWSTDITTIRLLHGDADSTGHHHQHGLAGGVRWTIRLWRTVKYEDVYLKGYETLPTLLLGLTDYFLFYNGERRHQSLGYATPDVVYHTATGGGAKIVDKFNSAWESIVPAEELGQRQPAAV